MNEETYSAFLITLIAIFLAPRIPKGPALAVTVGLALSLGLVISNLK